MMGGMAKQDNYIFHSSLPPVALAEKMLTLIGEGKKARAADGVIGNGSEQEMTLFVRRRKNSPAIEYKADLEAEGSGTRIDGKFKSAGGLGLFKIIFLGIGAIFMAVGLGGLVSGAPLLICLPFIGVPLFQWMILFTILRTMRKNGAEERKKILAFMHKHLELDEAPQGARRNGEMLH